MKKIPPRRKMGNITNDEYLEIVKGFVKRVANHWAHWLQYKGRACRDKQICKACNLVCKGFSERYAKKV